MIAWIAILPILLSPFQAQAQALSQGVSLPFRVVIDPGHGGADLGTVYDNGRVRIAEKNITLMLAQEAAKQLKARGFEVVLTRATDKEVPLAKRTALANRLGADVFLSIHMNSTATPMVSDAQGVETYILNNATDASSRRLAQLENSVVAHEESDTPEQKDVALILKDLRLDANLSESKNLACALQTELVSGGASSSKRNRGVKQALFHVLLGADMPSVLLEAGFLTSPQDRAQVLSVKGRQKISAAIAQAVEQYRQLKNGSRRLAGLSRCKVN
jgi:N-acetylmuramoyl-L-alanine amidase